MPTKAAVRRNVLRETLIDLAERRIAQDGLAAVRARDLASGAGCAVGAIYTVFDDLTALILEVNARTFAQLGAAVTAELAGAGADTAAAQLVTMGLAYHHYAAANRRRWRAIFDVALPPGTRPPDWYLAAMDRLFDMIAVPVAAVFADLNPTDRRLLTRALFSSVHGIVFLALDDAADGEPQAETDRMITLLLGQLSRRAGFLPPSGDVRGKGWRSRDDSNAQHPD